MVEKITEEMEKFKKYVYENCVPDNEEIVLQKKRKTKMTPEEIQERNRLYKQKQRENMKNKLGNYEYKNTVTQEQRAYRRNKNKKEQ